MDRSAPDPTAASHPRPRPRSVAALPGTMGRNRDREDTSSDARLEEGATRAPCTPQPDVDRLAPLDGVKATLTVLADAAHLAAGQSPHAARHASILIRDGVLDCVAALDRVQSTLDRQDARFRQLEQNVSSARVDLARARAELGRCQARERRARELSLHDPLTSLPNRRYFLERLEQAVAEARPNRSIFAVLYLDLDDFKTVNDLHGHAAGDQLLRIVAARLLRLVRADDIMSRLGGDEFACLILRPPSHEALGQLARKLFETASAPLTSGTLTLAVRPSIGVAVYPADGASAEALLESADGAMYRAKQHRTMFAFCDRRVADSQPLNGWNERHAHTR